MVLPAALRTVFKIGSMTSPRNNLAQFRIFLCPLTGLRTAFGTNSVHLDQIFGRLAFCIIVIHLFSPLTWIPAASAGGSWQVLVGFGLLRRTVNFRRLLIGVARP